MPYSFLAVLATVFHKPASWVPTIPTVTVFESALAVTAGKATDPAKTVAAIATPNFNPFVVIIIFSYLLITN